MKKLLAVLAAAVLFTAAQAAVADVVVGYDYNGTVTDSNNGDTLDQYTVWIEQTDPTDTLGAIDLAVVGDGNNIHQVGNNFGAYLPTLWLDDAVVPVAPADMATDTHLLWNEDDFLKITAPSEDFTVSTGIDGFYEHGYGTTFDAGVIARSGGFPAGVVKVDLLQVVLKQNTTTTLSGAVSTNVAGEHTVDGMLIEVPEPTTLALLGLGGLGALIRRRR